MPDQQAMVAIVKRDDRVLIQRAVREAKGMDWMIVPAIPEGKLIEADIVAVGLGVPLRDGEIRPLSVHVGDRVRLRDWSGTKVWVDGEELMIMTVSDLMSVIDAGASTTS